MKPINLTFLYVVMASITMGMEKLILELIQIMIQAA